MSVAVEVRNTGEVPRRPPDDPSLDEWIAWRVGWEREQRGWTQTELARRVTEHGAPIRQQTVWEIENRNPPRKISYAEAVAFAGAFEFETVAELARPPSELTVDIRRQIGQSVFDLAQHLGPLVRLLREAQKLPPDSADDQWQDVLQSLRDRAAEIGKAIAEIESWLSDTGAAAE